MSQEYGMNDLQFGKGLLCTQSNESHWTEGKIYPLSKGLTIQDDDKDVTWYSNEVLNFLNCPNSNRAFDLISLDEEIDMGMEELKNAVGVICKFSKVNYWTEGKLYEFNSNFTIEDNDGTEWYDSEVLSYINNPSNNVEFELVYSNVININSPNYYTEGIETKDYIRSHNLNFNRGSAVKYATRAGKKDKDKEIEDLKKAINFLQFEIDYLENGVANKHDYANNGVWKFK